MSSTLPMPAPQSTLDEDAWEDLLNFIEEKRVIPIIGPDLLKVETEAGPRLLYDWLAEKLAARLNVDPALLPQPYTLNDVVCWFLSSRGRREEAYTRLRTVLRDANFAPPLALRQLAQITDFDLFVTTTFDTLLEQAVNTERFRGAQSVEVIAYAPNRVADLPCERELLQRPCIYHLLGRISASPTYVISDEDTLEFVCALQSEHLTPEKLFHELEHNHLLLIGSNFSNWLVRLFLRMTKRRRLSDPRDVGEVLADNHSGSDERLMAFLQQVSVRTRIYSGAEQFVDELHRRWQARPRRAAASGGAFSEPAMTSRSPYERKLAAIVFTDVVGYSARMQRDESATLALVRADFERMRAICAPRGGEVFNTMGDGMLLGFPSAVEAVAFALQMQGEFAARRAKLPPERALEHRIGIHLGDVIRQAEGGVAGDGVNIAARLQTKSPPGGVCISQTVYNTVSGKVPMQAVLIGPEQFKNITEPISIYHIAPEGGPALTRQP